MGASDAVITGRVEPGWEAVHEAFALNFAEHGDVGAGVAVHHRGRLVVDLTGGWFDAEQTLAYDDSTLQLVFSTTKGVTALLCAALVDEGRLDPAATVASYWPEFAQNGKQAITVDELLSHRAGLPTIDATLTLAEALDWLTVTAALAAQAPLWLPGTKHGYHALTFGWLAGELIRRITGRSPGAELRHRAGDALGLDLWIGLPESEEARVSPLLAAPPPDPAFAELIAQMMGPDTLGGRALSLNGTFGAGATGVGETSMAWNTRAVHAAEVPAANGIGNARSLSRLYAAALADVDGVHLFSPRTRDLVSRTRTSGSDACLLVPTTFGLGFMTAGQFSPMLGEGSFGHAGAGGSLAFAHPASEVAFAYVMNQMDNNLAGDPRVAGLLAAVQASL